MLHGRRNLVRLGPSTHTCTWRWNTTQPLDDLTLFRLVKSVSNKKGTLVQSVALPKAKSDDLCKGCVIGRRRAVW
jgi:hypothetical protein